MDLTKTPRRRAHDVMDQVAAENGMTREMLLGDSRDRKVAAVRQEAMYQVSLIRNPVTGKLLFPFPETVARMFNRDRTTFLYALKTRNIQQDEAA